MRTSSFFLILICFSIVLIGCNGDEQQPDQRAFLEGKWKMDVNGTWIFPENQTRTLEFEKSGNLIWQSGLSFSETKSYWVYNPNSQELKLFSPDRNFVIVEKLANQFIARELPAGAYFTFTKEP